MSTVNQLNEPGRCISLLSFSLVFCDESLMNDLVFSEDGCYDQVK